MAPQDRRAEDLIQHIRRGGCITDHIYVTNEQMNDRPPVAETVDGQLRIVQPRLDNEGKTIWEPSPAFGPPKEEGRYRGDNVLRVRR